MVVYGLSSREILASGGFEPDFLTENHSVLDYIHRQDGDINIYFIRNKSEKDYSGRCSFRISGKYPELWDPSTGKQTRLAEFDDDGRRTNINLDLGEGASIFVVFTGAERPDLLIANTSRNSGTISTIDDNWEVSFPKGWGAPEITRFDKLISWTESDNEGIKYFSGTASYHNTFSIPGKDIENSIIEIDLGEVCDVAEVFINSKFAGILWKPPFSLDISNWIQAGENDLNIKVVNQWVNRLTGDMLLDPAERYCSTNQPYITRDDFGYDNWAEGGDETFRLKASGLLGPVKLLYSNNNK